MIPLRIVLVTAALLSAFACRTQPDRWEEGQKQAEAAVAQKAEAKAAGIAPRAVHGKEFNKFFPADGVDGLKRTFTAEKEDGFAEAKFEKAGVEARVAISDTVTNPDAVAKYAAATDKLGDAPVMSSGMKTSALVKGRFQVSVMSQQLDAAARRALLEKADLAGLAGVPVP